MADRYECMKESMDCDMITACMGAKGYYIDRNGPFFPPKGMRISCGQSSNPSLGQSAVGGFAGGLKGFGDALQQAARQPQQQTTTCRSDGIGGVVCTTR